MDDLRNKRVVVAGLGKFGGNIAAARWLAEQGARVLVTDQAPAEKLADSVKHLEDVPLEWRMGEHREADFATADLIVASPAIPPGNAYLAAATAAGVPITTEISLFIERCPATIIGVTGTKGKSTTTAMLGTMLRARFATFVGGNIGGSLLAELGRIGKKEIVVLELSSFMLHYLSKLQWSPHIGVITMLSADHLDWHGSQQAYLEAKGMVVAFQRPDDVAVLNENCNASRQLKTAGRVVWFGVSGRQRFELGIPGEHNQINAQAAFAAANVLGITWDEAQAALRTFSGLAHRLALVHEENGVKYYDDSIATIPEAAIAALYAFPIRKVLQIVGGYDKGLPFTAMCVALIERAKAVLCIGKTGDVIAKMLEDSGERATEVFRCGDLKTAVGMARREAKPGDVVLLSTGCASYDQFSNFEERGHQFARFARREDV